MMFAMVDLHELSVVSKHVSLCHYTRRAAPTEAAWTRILKSLMKIPIEISKEINYDPRAQYRSVFAQLWSGQDSN